MKPISEVSEVSENPLIVFRPLETSIHMTHKGAHAREGKLCSENFTDFTDYTDRIAVVVAVKRTPARTRRPAGKIPVTPSARSFST